MEAREIRLTQLAASRNFRTERLNVTELQESIQEHGVLQPIRVRPVARNKYQIIAGHRRFAASVALGLKTIPAVIVDESDESAAVQTLVENLQREDLSPLELTQGIRQLQTAFDLSTDEISRAISKSPNQVRAYLRLAQLPDDVLGRLESGEGRTQVVRGLTPRHVQPLVSGVPPAGEGDDRPESAALIDEATANVRQLREELDHRGVQINAHMADAIGRNVRGGRMTVAEAVDDVLANADQYRYARPTSSAEELEQDTWSAYRRIEREIGTLVHQLKPEIASVFSPPQRKDLLELLTPYAERLERYREALSGIDETRSETRQLRGGDDHS